jgi:predicted RNase H-like nuclease (RuvC/YqgF family)
MRDEKGNIIPLDQLAFERTRLADLASKRLKSMPDVKIKTPEQEAESEPDPVITKDEVKSQIEAFGIQMNAFGSQISSFATQVCKIENEIEKVTETLLELKEKTQSVKRQDIDALFRNRCARRRTEGFCKLTAKGKEAKGANPNSYASLTSQ